MSRRQVFFGSLYARTGFTLRLAFLRRALLLNYAAFYLSAYSCFARCACSSHPARLNTTTLPTAAPPSLRGAGTLHYPTRQFTTMLRQPSMTP